MLFLGVLPLFTAAAWNPPYSHGRTRPGPSDSILRSRPPPEHRPIRFLVLFLILREAALGKVQGTEAFRRTTWNGPTGHVRAKRRRGEERVGMVPIPCGFFGMGTKTEWRLDMDTSLVVFGICQVASTQPLHLMGTKHSWSS